MSRARDAVTHTIPGAGTWRCNPDGTVSRIADRAPAESRSADVDAAPVVGKSDRTHLKRSDAIYEAMTRGGREPTKAEKSAYWTAFAADTMARLKSTASQMRFALKHAAWAFAKATKAERAIDDLGRRMIALERRIESERKGFHYAGVWQEGETYSEHDFTTHKGGLWCCLHDGTTDRPGTSDRWQLAVKSGRPGRDARGA